MWRRLGLVAMKEEVQAMLAGYNHEIKSEMAEMQRKLTLMVDKDMDKVVQDLAIARVDQDYL